MNKKGFAVLVYFMVGVLFFLVGIALAPALNQTSAQAMDNPQLNCSSLLTNISNQDKANCTSIDMQGFIFTGIIFGLGGLLITRVILQ